MRVVLLHTKDVKRRRKTRDKWSIRFLKMHFPNLPEKTLRSEVTRDKWGFPILYYITLLYDPKVLKLF